MVICTNQLEMGWTGELDGTVETRAGRFRPTMHRKLYGMHYRYFELSQYQLWYAPVHAGNSQAAADIIGDVLSILHIDAHNARVELRMNYGYYFKNRFNHIIIREGLTATRNLFNNNS